MGSVKDKVDLILKKVIKGDKTISPEKDLFDDLGLTSLHVVQIMAMVEDEFNILIPLNEIQHVRTVQDLYQEMEKRVS